MDRLTIVSFLILAFAFFKLLLSFSNRGKKLPPGPFQLPIIGNLTIILGKLPHQSLAKLAQIYGPIMHLRLGRLSTIVISSPTIAQQVFQKQDNAFSSRFTQDALRACDHFKYSLIWSPVGPRWRNLRKLVTSAMFSVNKLDANQKLRSRKVNELIAYVKNCSQVGEAVDIGCAAFKTSFNVLSNIICSKDMADPDQDTAKEFRDFMWDMLVQVGTPNLVDVFPVLKRMDPQGINRRMTADFKNLLKMSDSLIQERFNLRRSGSPVENIDALDEFIKISQENPDQIENFSIKHLLLDLFSAGIDTTSSTMEWALAEVLKSSEIMAKAKAELNQVVGKGKIVEEADICGLPYLQCIVKETLRLHPPLPFLVPRQIHVEAEVEGYTIPKNSQVLINVWAIGRDPGSWKNPLSFHPERFLDTEVDVKGRDFELIPFGAGRRLCPAVPLVMRMVPLVLGSLINCFDWALEGGIPLNELDMEEKFGFTLAKLHPLCAVAIPVPV